MWKKRYILGVCSAEINKKDLSISTSMCYYVEVDIASIYMGL